MCESNNHKQIQTKEPPKTIFITTEHIPCSSNAAVFSLSPQGSAFKWTLQKSETFRAEKKIEKGTQPKLFPYGLNSGSSTRTCYRNKPPQIVVNSKPYFKHPSIPAGTNLHSSRLELSWCIWHSHLIKINLRHNKRFFLLLRRTVFSSPQYNLNQPSIIANTFKLLGCVPQVNILAIILQLSTRR